MASAGVAKDVKMHLPIESQNRGHFSPAMFVMVCWCHNRWPPASALFYEMLICILLYTAKDFRMPPWTVKII